MKLKIELFFSAAVSCRLESDCGMEPCLLQHTRNDQLWPPLL